MREVVPDPFFRAPRRNPLRGHQLGLSSQGLLIVDLRRRNLDWQARLPELHVRSDVIARILYQVYEIGRKWSDTFRDIKDQLIRHDDVLGQWNYVVDAHGVA